MKKATLLVALLLVHCISGLSFAWEDDEDLDLEDADEEIAMPSGDLAAVQARNFIVSLTDQSAQNVVSSNEYVLLLGYASWCARSSALMPEFAAAAATMSGSVVFAKLDAVSNKKAAALYKIKGFPTVLFFRNGSSELYPGGDSREDIVNWLRKKTGSPVLTIDTVTSAQDLLRTTPVFVAGFFTSFQSRDYANFLDAAKLEIGTPFVQTTHADVAKVLNTNIEDAPAIWLHKNETLVPFDGAYTTAQILHFVEINKLPLLIRMTSKTVPKINASPVKSQVLLFASADDFRDLKPVFEDVARVFKGKMLFLTVDYSDEEVAMPLLSVYGLQAGNPIVAAFNYENGHKYLLEEDANRDSLMSFCQDILSGNKLQYYKSAAVPCKKKGHLEIVVGKNLEAVVFDESKDVLLEVTTPWCAMCDAANRTFEKLAAAFKDVDTVVIAQFDASQNEHPRLRVDDYPTFLFFPAGKKEDPVAVSSSSKLQSLIQFVKNNAAIRFSDEGSDGTKDEL